MATCKDCIHNDVCRGVYLAIQGNTKLTLKEFQILCEKEDFDNQDIALYDCLFFQDRSRFVELPFEQNKGASPFDKVAHTTYTLATESHRVASFTIEGYYLMYNEERLYTLEKDGIVILVQGSLPHDVVEKAKLAIEKLSKERESNA